jgi:hypothetical protein
MKGKTIVHIYTYTDICMFGRDTAKKRYTLLHIKIGMHEKMKRMEIL